MPVHRRWSVGCLVFVDETGTNTSLVPLYAWSRRGERARFRVARNWGANVTLLLASMSLEGMGPCLSVEGPTTKAVFEASAERALAPSLRPGQVVVVASLGMPGHCWRRGVRGARGFFVGANLWSVPLLLSESLPAYPGEP